MFWFCCFCCAVPASSATPGGVQSAHGCGDANAALARDLVGWCVCEPGTAVGEDTDRPAFSQLGSSGIGSTALLPSPRAPPWIRPANGISLKGENLSFHALSSELPSPFLPPCSWTQRLLPWPPPPRFLATLHHPLLAMPRITQLREHKSSGASGPRMREIRSRGAFLSNFAGADDREQSSATGARAIPSAAPLFVLTWRWPRFDYRDCARYRGDSSRDFVPDTLGECNVSSRFCLPLALRLYVYKCRSVV